MVTLEGILIIKRSKRSEDVSDGAFLGGISRVKLLLEYVKRGRSRERGNCILEVCYVPTVN